MVSERLRYGEVPHSVHKYKIPCVIPCRTRRELGALLLNADTFENIHNHRCGGDRPRLAVFGSTDIMGTAFFFALLQLLFDSDRTILEIDGIP